MSQPSQEDILSVLKNKHLNLTKISTPEEQYLFEWMSANGLMHPKNDTYQSITNEGYAFIRNSAYINPVPIYKEDWVYQIISELSEREKQLYYTGDLFRSAYNELIDDGFITRGSNSLTTKLTSKGRLFVNSGKSRYEFLNEQHMPSIRIGHNIGGSVHGSDLNINLPSTPNNTNNKEKNKTHILQIIYWLIGIATAIGGLYTYLHSKHVWIF
ncbi:hypothetical protein [Mucilaginibacter pedocola]|uniref:Uncharacterized protein n=1 Tax=Mucilaginibacter pedocola TaxID=1792845 RepID=A0A1S9PJ09_9SPHI|nr:hypothetical protein [Mucilaginibacter pedocola]OOQ60919.1 hypothetical protein BC343_23445 [Mucilaginibacter pedocola]